MSNNNDFNPEAWQTPSEKPTSPNVAPKATAPMPADDVAADVELILQQIEERHLDITFDHDHWYRTGFAFADQFGEAGREYFHRACQFYPTYSREETDRQYDYCLHNNREGVTIRTFFGYAKDAGIDLRTRTGKSPVSPKPPKSPQNPAGENGEIGDSGGEDQVALPTFSGQVYPHLTDFLKQIADVGESPQETDALLLGALTAISSCLPNVQGRYDGVTVYANLFYFLTARAASGKGRLDLCRYLVRPIHRRLKELHELEYAKYEQELAQWEGASKKTRGPKPEKPAQTMLIIPANTSATAVYQLLNDNGGKGLIFETEGDTLANAFESDFGNFSDGFRKAFHHEPISYHRRGGDEDVEIESPQLSTVLTGTPRQIVSLIRDAENGLFSRFIFYRLVSKLQWKDVLADQTTESLDDKFSAMGERYVEFYDAIIQNGTVRFSVTPSQRQKFNDYFSGLQEEFYKIFKDDILASVRRLGLICYRLAMILSALRMMDNSELTNDLVCEDEDFDVALTMCRTLAVHTARVFDELSSIELSRSTSVAKSSKRQSFFAALPDDFDRQDYLEAAERTGVPPSTAEKWIRAFCADDGPLEKVEHGRYRKRQ